MDSNFKFPAEDLLRRPVRLVCVWRLTLGRRYCAMHSHPMVELVYHNRGSGVTVMEDGQKIHFEPHGTVLYPAGVRHEQAMESNGEDICLHIECGKAAPALRSRVATPFYVPPLPADPFVRSEFLQLAQVGFDRSRRLELDLRATALLVRLLDLGRAFKEGLSPDPAEMHVVRARQYIRENYQRIESVGEIARHVGVSEDYLRHVFAEKEGSNLNRLVTEARIERAKELLIHSRLALKEIASLCGFQTERYLSARFKQSMGCSPGVFRRQAFDPMPPPS